MKSTSRCIKNRNTDKHYLGQLNRSELFQLFQLFIKPLLKLKISCDPEEIKKEEDFKCSSIPLYLKCYSDAMENLRFVQVFVTLLVITKVSFSAYTEFIYQFYTYFFKGIELSFVKWWDIKLTFLVNLI